MDILQTALNDLDEIILYMASYSKEVAIKWHDKLIEACNRLAVFPEMGVLVPDDNLTPLEFRMVPIGNYIIFYRVYYVNQEVTVLRVLDARRDYPRFFNNYIKHVDE